MKSQLELLKKNDDAKESEEEVVTRMTKQIRDEFKKKLDDFNKQIIDEDASNPTMQNIIAKYAFINANEN